VAFEFAFATEDSIPTEMRSGVLGQPRESFWPFYLRDRKDPGLTSSYNASTAIPAGRKRTMVRRTVLPAWPPGNENEGTITHVRFLPAGVVFEGRIRVHNLHPVEFGALLWALTFGDLSGDHWHQAGRAKGFGHGALQPKIEFVRSPTAIGTNVTGELGQFETWINAFFGYMDAKLRDKGQPAYSEHPSIKALTDMADPDTSALLADSLEPWDLPGYAGHITNVRGHHRRRLEGEETGAYLLEEPEEWRN
jgi:hypothetical protein